MAHYSRINDPLLIYSIIGALSNDLMVKHSGNHPFLQSGAGGGAYIAQLVTLQEVKRAWIRRLNHEELKSGRVGRIRGREIPLDICARGRIISVREDENPRVEWVLRDARDTDNRNKNSDAKANCHIGVCGGGFGRGYGPHNFMRR